MSDVEWCVVCNEYYNKSRIEVRRHIMKEHTLSERLESLHEKGPEPEDTHA